MENTSRRNIAYLIVFSVIVMMFSSIIVNRYSFKGHPASGDEASLWFQTELFKEGKLWNQSLDKSVMGLFKRHHVVTTEEREYSKYPPGPALLFAMIPGDYNGFIANALLNCIIYTAGILILLELGFLFFMMLIFSSFFIFSAMITFNGASWFSHPGAAALTAIALLFLIKGEKNGKRSWYLLSGTVTGISIFMRPFDAALLLGAVLLYFLMEFLSSFNKFGEIFRKLFFIFLGILPFFILFLIYQKIYTGSFFRSPYSLYVFSADLRTGEKIGEITLTPFHYFKYGLGGLTPLWLKNMMRWTNPLVVPAAIIAVPFFFKFRQKKTVLRLFVLVPLMFILGYALHNAPGGDSYGPRYYYPAMVCWFILASYPVCFLIKKYLPGETAQAVVIFIIATSTAGMAMHKHFAVADNIKDRFNIFTYCEKRLPDEKALIFVNNAKTFDPAFYIRHRPDLSDRIIYIRRPVNSGQLSTVMNLFPDRTVYDYNYHKSTGRQTLKKVEPEVR